MLKKILLFIIIFINLASCGFVPINDLNNNKKFKDSKYKNSWWR